MTHKEAFDYFISAIIDHFGAGEARSIVKIIFEDLFLTKDFVSSNLFDRAGYLDSVIHRLLDDEPVAYITGSTLFYGLTLSVNPHVLVPRPETEELVRIVLAANQHKGRQLDVLDIGVGSGCIGLALKKNRPSWRVFGVEWSLDAINVARNNAKRIRLDFPIFRLDFLDEGSWHSLGKFDVIVSNPPYIPRAEQRYMSANVLKFEPEMALYPDGVDPLIFYRQLVKFCAKGLKQQGVVFVEINEFFELETKEIFYQCFGNVHIEKDMSNKPRILVASNYTSDK